MDPLRQLLALSLTEQKAQFAEIARQGNLDSLPMLQRLVLEADHPETRYYANKVLHLLRRRHGMKDSFSEAGTAAAPDLHISRVLEALASSDYRKKLAALKGILKYRLLEAVPHIIKALRTEKDPVVLSYMVKVAGVLGDERIIEEVGRLVQHANARVRANAVEALDDIGSSRGYPWIITAMRDEDNRVRANALKALRKVGRQNVMKLLKAMIYSKKLALVDSACYVLGFMEPAPALELFKTALRYNALSINLKIKAALENFSRAGVEEARTLLQSMGADSLEDDELKAIAAELEADFSSSAIEFVDEKTKPAVAAVLVDENLEALSGESTAERIRTVQELVDVGGAKILELLRDEARETREPKLLATLVKAIGRLGSDEDVPFLVSFLSDSDARVRANTIEALRMIDVEPCLIELTVLMQEDASNRVVANAIMALAPRDEINVLPALSNLIARGDEWSLKSAFFVIVETGLEEFLPLLEEILDRADGEFRTEVLEHLQLLKEQGSLLALHILRGPDTLAGPALEVVDDITAIEPATIDTPISADVPLADEPEQEAVESMPAAPKTGSDLFATEDPFLRHALDLLASGSESVAAGGIEILRHCRCREAAELLRNHTSDPRDAIRGAAQAALVHLEEYLSRQDLLFRDAPEPPLGFKEKERFDKLLQAVRLSSNDFITVLREEISYRNNRPVIRAFLRYIREASPKERQLVFTGSCELIALTRRENKPQDSASEYLPLFLAPALGKTAVEFLDRLILDPLTEMGLRTAAVMALGLVVTPASFTRLSQAYYDTEQSVMFRDVARALGYHASAGSTDAWLFLHRSLMEDSTMRRQDAIHGLAVSGDLRALGAFTDAWDAHDLYLKESMESGLNILSHNIGKFNQRISKVLLGENDLIINIFNERSISGDNIPMFDQPDRIFEYIARRIS